jgi:hypothetical protein
MNDARKAKAPVIASLSRLISFFHEAVLAALRSGLPSALAASLPHVSRLLTKLIFAAP